MLSHRPPLLLALFASCLLHAFVFLALMDGGIFGTSGKISPSPFRPLTLRLSDLSRPLPEEATTVSQNSPLIHSLQAPVSTADPLARRRVDPKNGNEVEDEGEGGDAGSPAFLPYYYPASELDDPPRIVGEVDFDDAELASHPEGGSVVLRLLIDERGTVERVSIDETSVAPEITMAASAHFAAARARPGSLHGRAVKSTLLVEISYAPANIENRPGRD